MRPQSAKAKGRRLQQLVAARLRAVFDLPDTDVKSLPMGSQGSDIWMSASAYVKFPFVIECKAQEQLNVWKGFAQAVTHVDSAMTINEVCPLLVFTRNRDEVLCCLRFEDLLELLKDDVSERAILQEASREVATWPNWKQQNAELLFEEKQEEQRKKK